MSPLKYFVSQKDEIKIAHKCMFFNCEKSVSNLNYAFTIYQKKYNYLGVISPKS